MKVCTNPKCKADLTKPESVTRQYYDKDDTENTVDSEGHYENGEHFEPDGNTSLSGGRFDLADDSDKCTSCNAQLWEGNQYMSASNQEQSVELEFTVKVKYSFNKGTPFCKESARENLIAAIEKERQNGMLACSEISADWVTVNELNSESNTVKILDVNTKQFGILLNNTYWLQNFNEENHEDGHCVMGRDGDDALEFSSINEAQEIIKEEPELEGAIVEAHTGYQG